MNCQKTFQSSSHILVGFAIDVSGSMEESIRNNSDENVNRFDSFRDSLKQLSKEAKQAIKIRQKEGTSASIDVFAYAFGLKDVDYCDLLTLVKLGAEITSDDKGEKLSSFGCYNYYEELVSIAKHFGVQDINTNWIKDTLNESEAENLVKRLRQFPRIAKHLANLLPKNNFDAGINLLPKNIINPVSDINDFFGAPISFSNGQSNQNKAKALARELANASSDEEVRKIVIREVGSRLDKELSKHGNTTMPLEEVADLLETTEDVLEDAESLIYGMTPMRNTLNAVKKRFEEELTKLPDDTIPVLFILSDGLPNDGDPLPIAQALKNKEIEIVSCFVTNQDITHPRRLFDSPELQWSDGAKLMFNMASSIDENSVFTRFLQEIGWKVPPQPKLFVQVNHSDIMNEFIQVVLSPLKEK